MKAFALIAPAFSTEASTRPIHGAVSIANALTNALRDPSLASPKLRPIADEMEARRARR